MSKILVVDDDRRVRRMLRKLFTKEGFGCTTAADGEQALARMQDLVRAAMREGALGVGLASSIEGRSPRRTKPDESPDLRYMPGAVTVSATRQRVAIPPKRITATSDTGSPAASRTRPSR